MNVSIGSASKTIQNRIVYDQELVVKLQRGDQWAFQLLVRRFRRRIFSIAYGITLDARESRDVMQDVFLQAYRRIGEFNGDSSLPTWLQRLTVNRCLNWKRRWTRRLKRGQVSLDRGSAAPRKTLDCDRPSSDNRLAKAQTCQQIDRALRKLPEPIRAVFVLKELERLSYEEIAQTIGIKVKTARSRLFQARKRLKATLLSPLKEN
ncbi:MAG: sigma-70 family RNA polymerase sigma factor [Desulfosarcina sp.]